MVQLWVIIGLVVSAVAVSFLGALFSILGLGKLFSGAILAVWFMAGSLELAKFVVAAYLHQTWYQISFLFRSYLLSSVVILSLITSMGIFGFLSDAYTTSAISLDTETIKLQRLENEQRQALAEAERVTRSVDEIPDKRITRKLKARADIEPLVRELKAKADRIDGEIAAAKIKILDVKQKVGPLIYISKAFNKDIDTVVKYLILVFVSVFDPLAICLVIALSDAVKKRQNKHLVAPASQSTASDQPRSEGEDVSKNPGATSSELPILRMRYADSEIQAPIIEKSEDLKKEAV